MNLKVGEIYLWKSDIFPSSQVIVLHKILYIKNSYVTMDKYELERRKIIVILILNHINVVIIWIQVIYLNL